MKEIDDMIAREKDAENMYQTAKNEGERKAFLKELYETIKDMS